MSLLATALRAHAKFGYIFQCGEKSKQPNPVTAPRGVNSSTNDRATIERWWTDFPNANIGIDLGRSGLTPRPGLTVLDIDQGIADVGAAREFCAKVKLPPTFTVRTGRRDGFGLQLFFQGLTRNHPYSYGSISGEIRSAGYYVLAPGSIHPVSGEPYVILADRPFAPMPALILELTKERAPRPQGTETKKVPASWRHYYLVERARELYFAGLAGSELDHALRWLYEHRCAHDPAKDERIARDEVTDICKWIAEHPPDYPLEPGDFIKLRFAEKDEKFRAAYDANLAAFGGDKEQAFDYVVKVLKRQGCREEQLIRLIASSPLGTEIEKEEGDGAPMPTQAA